jgi:hypothetical protein
MSHYALKIQDEAKGKDLVSFLKTLDFVQVSAIKAPVEPANRKSNAFFAAKGLWKKRQITGKKLRELAWNRDSN